MSKVLFIFVLSIVSSVAQAEEMIVFGETWTVVSESEELQLCLNDDVCRMNQLDSIHTYVVQAGDTQYSVAKARGLTVEELLFANPDLTKGNLVIGQIINIPSID